MAGSLAEMCHVWPTNFRSVNQLEQTALAYKLLSGGQYDWTYMLSPPRRAKGLSYFVGWMACAAWTSLVATGSSLGANFIIGIISLLHPNYVSQRWHIFLIYVVFTVGAFLLNTFAVRLLPLVDRTAFFWSLTGIVVVIITLLATASGEYQPASFVFGRFINETGWPTGVTFI